MKQRVYVETSIVSYLTARPSRDVVTFGNQVATREWWREAVNRFELVASPLVVEESSAGDPQAEHVRLAALESIQVIATNEDADELGRVLVEAGALPDAAAMDATHVAIAAVNKADFLVTWNMRRLANPVAAARIAQACREAGHEPPAICTPSELTEIYADERITDPIVEEVRRVRAELAARHGNDVVAIIRHAQAQEGWARRAIRQAVEEMGAAPEERGYNPPPVAKVVRPKPSPPAPRPAPSSKQQA